MDIRTVCLGLLTFRDATGYEIKKLFEAGSLSRGLEASFGSIYPALGNLAKDGLVAVTPAPGRGRTFRKVYSITAAGREAFAMALQQTPEPDRFRSEFIFYLSFVHLMTKEQVDEFVDLQIFRIKSSLARLEAETKSSSLPSRQLVLGYGQAMANAMVRYLIEHRAEIGRLALRSSDEDVRNNKSPQPEAHLA